MFTKIKQKLIGNKRLLFKIAIFFGIYFLFSEFSFAEAAVNNQNGDLLNEETKQKIVTLIQWINTIISIFLGLMTYLVTLFLSPEWTNGSIFGMDEHIKKIWILVSNVVYFAFAFILIFIAFANIVGFGGNKFELKQSLPKFIVGILIVPFSLFIVQFLIGLSSILTIASLNLPFEAFKDYKSKIQEVEIPKDCTINLKVLGSKEASNDSGGGSGGATSNQIFSCGEGTISLAALMRSDKFSDGIFGMVSLYTYGIVGVEGIDKLNKRQLAEQIKTIGDVVVKVVFDLLFIVVYALLMIALGLALMIRGVRLWIFMMMAPLFGLMYFFEKSNGGGGFFEKFNIKEFLGLVMVPVLAMLSLSFGMFFIYVTGTGMTQSAGTTDEDIIKLEQEGIKLGDFNLKIEGAASTDQEITKTLKIVGNGALGVVGTLILKIFGVVVLWGTLMAALKSSKVTEAIVKPIAQFGENVAQVAQMVPQYTPILPNGQSFASINQGMQQIQSKISSSAYSDAERFTRMFGGGVPEILDLSTLKENIEAVPKNNFEGQKKIVDYLTTNYNTHKNDQKFLDLFNQAAEKFTGTKSNLNTGNSSDPGKIREALTGFNKNVIAPEQIRPWASNPNGSIYGTTTGTVTPPTLPKVNISSPVTVNIGTAGTPTRILSSGDNREVSDIATEISSNLGSNKIPENTLRMELTNKGIDNNVIEEIIRQLNSKGNLS